VLLHEESVGEGRKSRSNTPVADLRRETGQSLVEFALILPLVLSILFGIVEFGRGFQSWLAITNAAAYGARTGAVGASAAAIDAATRDAAASLDPNILNLQITNAQGAPGDPVNVRVTYDLPMITPIFAILVPGGFISITADATQRLE
jgi:Flp pilus assembly protein TadG